MAVQHLRLPDIPGELGGSAGEEGESPVFILTAVDPLGIEHGMPHQIDGQAVGGMAGFVDSELGAHRLGAPDRLIRDRKLAPELPVARNDQPHIVPETGQSRGQRTDDIAHAAHLDHRGAFGGGEQDAHRWTSDLARRL